MNQDAGLCSNWVQLGRSMRPGMRRRRWAVAATLACVLALACGAAALLGWPARGPHAARGSTDAGPCQHAALSPPAPPRPPACRRRRRPDRPLLLDRPPPPSLHPPPQAGVAAVQASREEGRIAAEAGAEAAAAYRSEAAAKKEEGAIAGFQSQAQQRQTVRAAALAAPWGAGRRRGCSSCGSAAGCGIGGGGAAVGSFACTLQDPQAAEAERRVHTSHSPLSLLSLS